MNLAEFILARVAEDEAVARQTRDLDWESDDVYAQDARRDAQWHSSLCGWRMGEGLADRCECGVPARVLAECAAKRSIVHRYLTLTEQAQQMAMAGENGPTWASFDAQALAWGIAVRFLAQPYHDHPDFDPAWSVT